jgi:hypothetical protein
VGAVRTSPPLVVLGVALLAGCAGGTGAPNASEEPTRAFALGLTDFPSAASETAVEFAYRIIASDADMAVWVWSDGVPWPEALVGAPYPAALVADIERRASRSPPGHLVYVGVTPTAYTHQGLALYKGEVSNQPLPPPWNARSLDHPEVIGAYTNHCERIIAATRPHYFSYINEANMVLRFSPGDWAPLVRLASAVYPRLKASHPALPLLVTLQADTFHEDRALQAAVVPEILPYTDAIAVSTYPFRDQSDPLRLPEDHFSALRDLAPSKPFAIAETCWPAVDVGPPYPFYIPASDETQRLYVERLLREAERLPARFVSWSFPRDYDEFFATTFYQYPSLYMRLWMNCGLYTADAQARPALGLWRESLGRRRAR